jgi:hypothetical protein
VRRGTISPDDIVRITMLRRPLLLFAVLVFCLPAMAADPAAQWWADVSALAHDDMKGRLTGTPDYLRAAEYVIGRLRREGIKPAGVRRLSATGRARAAGGGSCRQPRRVAGRQGRRGGAEGG